MIVPNRYCVDAADFRAARRIAKHVRGGGDCLIGKPLIVTSTFPIRKEVSLW